MAYLYGIGQSNSLTILKQAGINPDVRAKDLTEDEISRITAIIQKEYRAEGVLRREVSMNIKRLMDAYAMKGNPENMIHAVMPEIPYKVYQNIAVNEPEIFKNLQEITRRIKGGRTEYAWIDEYRMTLLKSKSVQHWNTIKDTIQPLTNEEIKLLKRKHGLNPKLKPILQQMFHVTTIGDLIGDEAIILDSFMQLAEIDKKGKVFFPDLILSIYAT